MLQSALVGITYRWGGWGDAAAGLDCIGLADHARRYYGLPGLRREMIAWVYERWPSAEAAPPDLIDGIAKSVATTVTTPRQFDLVLIRSNLHTCLGTLLPSTDILFMDGCQSRCIERRRFNRMMRINGFVRPTTIVDQAASISSC
jgi:cell wall-associated NlpC family hydrolase